MSKPRGWYSRGHLPHLDAGEVPQFLTWRLADSIPPGLAEKWEAELATEPETKRKLELYRRYERYLDEGHGSCLLKNPVAAITVQNTLIFYHGALYTLHEWVVMPNHVHVLLTPAPNVFLAEIPKRVKGYSSTQINRQLGRQGQLWQAGYFDRLIRDADHFDQTALYIRRNPVKAKLVGVIDHWTYGSGNPRSRGPLEDKDRT